MDAQKLRSHETSSSVMLTDLHTNKYDTRDIGSSGVVEIRPAD